MAVSAVPTSPPRMMLDRDRPARITRVGSRVSAKRGPLLSLEPNQRRRVKARVFGRVYDSLEPGVFRVRRDYGTVSDERARRNSISNPSHRH